MASEMLTQRENQVAELIAWGAAAKEVPDLLADLYGGNPISVYTVQNILKSIYRKTGTTKANELSAWWFIHNKGIDAAEAPHVSIRNRLLSFVFLLILLPQIASHNLDQAIRTARARTPRPSRTERVERGRRREDGIL